MFARPSGSPEPVRRKTLCFGPGGPGTVHTCGATGEAFGSAAKSSFDKVMNFAVCGQLIGLLTVIKAICLPCSIKFDTPGDHKARVRFTV